MDSSPVQRRRDAETGEMETEGASLLQDKEGKGGASMIKQKDIPFCGFMSVTYYQPYFDVDTVDVLERLTHAFFYCKREQSFLTLIEQKPDAYGPFWISTSLVFTVAVVSHISGWLASWMKNEAWEYDFQAVLSAASIIFSFALFAPGLIWIVFKQYEKNLQFMNILCLYGYSLTSYIPATLLCLLPSSFSTWLSLLGASVMSGMFLLKNLAPYIVTHAKNQAALLLSLVGFIQLVLMLCMKFYFFYSS